MKWIGVSAYRRKGWFSRLLTLAGWFDQELGGQDGIVVEATGVAEGTSEVVGRSVVPATSGRVRPWRRYIRRVNPPIVLPPPELPAFEGVARAGCRVSVAARGVVAADGRTEAGTRPRVRSVGLVSTHGVVTLMAPGARAAARGAVSVNGDIKTIRSARAGGRVALSLSSQRVVLQSGMRVAARGTALHPREEEELLMLLEAA